MPPRKSGKTVQGGTKGVKTASTVSDDGFKAACEKRGGAYIPATETQAAICIVIPKEPNSAIQINRFKGDPCLGPVGPRDRYILVPPTRELAESLLRAMGRL